LKHVTAWRQSNVLKDMTPEQIRQALKLAATWNKNSVLKKMSPAAVAACIDLLTAFSRKIKDVLAGFVKAEDVAGTPRLQEISSRDYTWLWENIFWWTLPRTHPKHKARLESLQRSMTKEGIEFSRGVLSLEAIPWPRAWKLMIGAYIWPGWEKHRVKIFDKWDSETKKR